MRSLRQCFRHIKSLLGPTNMHITRKQLLDLPHREIFKTTIYDSIILFPTGRKHSSGWGEIAIIGCQKGTAPIEIAAHCDDVCYSIPDLSGFDKHLYNGYFNYFIRTDMCWPAKVSHVWSWYFNFEVGASLSSLEIKLIPKE